MTARAQKGGAQNRITLEEQEAILDALKWMPLESAAARFRRSPNTLRAIERAASC